MGNYTFIIDKFRQIQREIGLTNFTGFFEMADDGLPGIIGQKKLSVDVYHAAAALPLIRKTVKLLDDKGRYIFNIVTKAAQMGIGAFPNIQASVALLLIDEDFLDEAFLQHIIEQKRDDYRIILVRNYTGNAVIEDELRLKLPAFVEMVNLPLDTSENDDLMRQLDTSLNAKNYTPGKLIDIAISRSVTPLVNALKEIIATEARISATQKQLTSQDNNILRKEESGSLNSEITTATRQIIQKNILDTEKGLRPNMRKRLNPILAIFLFNPTFLLACCLLMTWRKRSSRKKRED